MVGTLELKTAPLGDALESALDGTLPHAMTVVKQAVARLGPRCSACGGDTHLTRDHVYLDEEYAAMGEQEWRCGRCGGVQMVPYRAYYLFN